MRIPESVNLMRAASAVRASTLVPALLFALASTEASAQIDGKIEVYPTTSSLEVGSTRQFSAYVPISPNTITWLVNDIPGGNAGVGTISATGFYTPPSAIPAANVLTIKAKSTAYPSSFGTATLTITRPYPWLWSASPSSIPVGAYRLTFNGSNFAPDSQALANGVPVTTQFVSSTSLIVTGAAAQPGTMTLAVRQPAPGAVTGNSISETVTAAVVKVTVAPSSASVQVATTRTFTATVTGTANPAVTWSVNGTPGGSPATGTIDASGVYTAPAAVPSPSAVTIRATSVASPASSGQAAVTVVAPVTVSISPVSVSLPLGGAQPFAATVTGGAGGGVTWSVNAINGGSAAVGTINSSGVYTAPAATPAGGSVTVRATANANPASFAQATVTLMPPIVVSVSPASVSLALKATQTFTATVTGNTNTAVTWSVNNTPGGSAILGTISAAGLYTAPAVLPSPATVTIRATSAASASAAGQASVTLTTPPPPTTWLSGARFLEQSSFGPTPATLAKVQQIGVNAYLDEQFSLPETPLFVPGDNSMSALRQWVLYNYSAAPDQLRQRVAYSLGEIIVTSANKLVYPDEMIPWLRLLSKHAFGNYRDLLRDISMSPSMGKYLDLANSMKPGLAGGANENYPRELMQLFSIGLWQLNQDGSQVLVNGSPVPAYDQQTVRQVALALTGWTYATAPGATPRMNNWEYFGAPMETRPSSHDTTAKTFLGCSLAAGQTVEQDLDSTIDCLMNHPNMAPFIATRLIRFLVMSNPSPGYIQRVADVFAGRTGGTQGDLKATVRAILTDVEARTDTATVNQGRLKEPILQVSGFLRALNGQFSSTQQLGYLFDYMSQAVLAPPSVFSWFSPLYRVPGSTLFGPEFQIYSPTEATLRGNLLYSLLSYPGSDAMFDLSPFQPYGNDMPNLVEAVNQVLLYGRMPAAMKQVLINAATPGYDATTRIQTVLYLTALSGQYAVQY